MAWRRFLIGLMVASFAGAAMAQSGSSADYITAASTLPVEDEVRIAGIIARMNHAIDQNDYPLYASFYAEDGVIDSGFGPPVDGRDAIIASLDQSAPFISNKRHAATNLVIFGQGDTATAIYYLVVVERQAGLTLAGTAMITDTFARGPEGWQLKRHETRMDPATLATLQQ